MRQLSSWALQCVYHKHKHRRIRSALVATDGSTNSLLSSQPAGTRAVSPAAHCNVTPPSNGGRRTRSPRCILSASSRLAPVPGNTWMCTQPQCTCSQHAAACALRRAGVRGVAGPAQRCTCIAAATEVAPACTLCLAIDCCSSCSCTYRHGAIVALAQQAHSVPEIL